MKLASMPAMALYEFQVASRNQAVAEGYGRTYTFDYPNYDKDPRPRALVLGYYQHPTSGNTLVGALNLNYMDRTQVARLQKALPAILRPQKLRARYYMGKRLLPDLFDNFYRTYNKDYINAISPGELRFGQQPGDAQKMSDLEKQKKIAQATQAMQQQKQQDAQKQVQATQAAAMGGHEVPELPPEDDEPETDAFQDALAAGLKAQRERRKKEIAARQALLEPEKPEPIAPEEPADEPYTADQAADEVEQLADEEPVGVGAEEGTVEPKAPTTSAFPLNKHRAEGRQRLAVFDVYSGKTVIGEAVTHADLLERAGWDYDHTVCFFGKNLTALHTTIPEEVVRMARGRVRARLASACTRTTVG